MTRKYLLLIAGVALLVVCTMLSTDGRAQGQANGNTESESRALASVLKEVQGERVLLTAEGKEVIGRCAGIVQGCLVKLVQGTEEREETIYLPLSRLSSVRVLPKPPK